MAVKRIEADRNTGEKSIVSSLSCSIQKSKIEGDLASLQSCEQDNDCISISDIGCFGPYRFVNKDSNYSKIVEEIQKFRGTCEDCEYSMAVPPVPVCQDNKCVAIETDIPSDFSAGIVVLTDRKEYKVGDYAYITIKNNFAKNSYKGIGYWGICFLSACTKSEESKISCLPLAGLDCTNSDSRIEPGKQVRLKYPIPLTESIVSFKFTYVEDPKSYTEETMSNQIVVR